MLSIDNVEKRLCQCPLGLLPHFYREKRSEVLVDLIASVNALSGCYLISTIHDTDRGLEFKIVCQCPLGLLPHFYSSKPQSINYLEEVCQCPLGLLPHFYEPEPEDDESDGEDVSMPSRAVTSFLQYHFKNLDFMRLPEPVFAGIYQNILTTAVFRAC